MESEIQVINFFMVTVPRRNPSVNLSDCAQGLKNYFLEKENDHLFNSEQYENEEKRIYAMFGCCLSEDELKMTSCKSYKHRAKPIEEKGHGEIEHEKRIKELEAEVTDPELIGIMAQKWWLD